MRTRQQTDQFLYNGLTTGEFAARTGQSPAQVRDLIASGWFGWTEDGQPECLDVSSKNAKQATYRIHASALKRYYRERAQTGQRKAS